MLNSNDLFDLAFYYSPIGKALVKLDGNFLKVNRALTKITGYTEEELLSITFQVITHPDDLEADLKQVQELIEGKKESYEMEKRYIHKNGNIVWVLLSCAIVREGDNPLFIIVQIQDITSRKELELNLTESEERFRYLLTLSPDPILVHNGKTILYANESAATLVDTTVGEIIGVSIKEFIEPSMLEKAYRLIKEVMVNNRPHYDFDLKLRSKSGQVIDAVLSAIPISYLGEKAVLVSYRNITERKKMEQALKESEERYRRLVEFSPLGILVHQKGFIKYVNSTAVRLLGAEKSEDMIGLNIFRIIHPDFKVIVSRRIENIEKDGQFAPPLYEKFIQLDGQEIDVEVNGMPIQLNGETAVQVVFWDVSEKKKEEDLIRYRAYHDTLTDLPNRLKFQLDLEDEINKDTTFTIMYLDLNGLKPINDSYGHQAGDMALIKVTSRLTGAIGTSGLVYRLGGDEFAVVVPGQKKEKEIMDIASRIAEILKPPIYISNTIVQISTSIGVVFYPDHGVEMDLLLRHADMAMYHSKKTKSLYKIYDR